MSQTCWVLDPLLSLSHALPAMVLMQSFAVKTTSVQNLASAPVLVLDSVVAWPLWELLLAAYRASCLAHPARKAMWLWALRLRGLCLRHLLLAALEAALAPHIASAVQPSQFWLAPVHRWISLPAFVDDIASSVLLCLQCLGVLPCTLGNLESLRIEVHLLDISSNLESVLACLPMFGALSVH